MDTLHLPNLDLDSLRSKLATLPIDCHFVTVSGAHLYGFASPDSDVDLRGAHRIKLENLVGLDRGIDTYEFSAAENGVEWDIVTHDIGKYLRLLMKLNGYVQEQIASPFVVMGKQQIEALRPLAKDMLTKHYARHFRGFAQQIATEFDKTPRAKSALYWIRVLLAGIHVLQSKDIESNLLHLQGGQTDPLTQDLIDLKTSGHEKMKLLDASLIKAVRQRAQSLEQELEVAEAKTTLPDEISDDAKNALNQWLVEQRLQGWSPR